MSAQGLMPSECDVFDIASAHAAFADWWNRARRWRLVKDNFNTED